MHRSRRKGGPNHRQRPMQPLVLAMEEQALVLAKEEQSPPGHPLVPPLVPTQWSARNGQSASGKIHQRIIKMHTGQAFPRTRYRQARCRLPG